MAWMITSKLFFWISSTETGVNCYSFGTTKVLVSYLSKPSDVPKLSLIVSIFSTKNYPKFSANSSFESCSVMMIP